MNIRKRVGTPIVVGIVIPATVLALTLTMSGHCQIPCGIYDDEARFSALQEHATTIEKSMKQIELLAPDAGGSANQLTRWVQNKEAHADKFAEIVTVYFLQQRIKPVHGPGTPGWDAYVKKLALCHQMLVTAMKAKQTTGLEHVQHLRQLLGEFRKAYLPATPKPAAAQSHER